MKLPKWSIGLSKRNLIIGGLLTAFVFGLFSWAGISGKLAIFGASEPGSISGKVYSGSEDWEQNDEPKPVPVANAQVKIIDKPINQGQDPKTYQPRWSKTVTTSSDKLNTPDYDETGLYRISDIPIDIFGPEYILIVSIGGRVYDPVEYINFQYYHGDGDDIDDVDIYLNLGGGAVKGGTLKGTITDQDTNQPLKDVYVQASVGAANNWYTAATKENGLYLIEAMPIGNYGLLATKTGYARYSGSVQIRENQPTTQDIKLKKSTTTDLGVTLLGRITDPAKQPLAANITLTKKNRETNAVIGQYTHQSQATLDQNRNINYLIVLDRGFNYEIKASKEGYKDSQPAVIRSVNLQNVTEYRQDLELPWLNTDYNKSRILGKVTLEGQTNHSGATVGLTIQDINTQAVKQTLQTTTDQEGKFLFENVQPGSATVVASKQGYRSDSKNFALGANQEVNVQLKLWPNQPNQLASVNGIIISRAVGLSLVEGAEVKLYDTSLEGEVAKYQTTTNNNGDYILSDILPGSYIIKISHPDYLEKVSDIIVLSEGDDKSFNFDLEVKFSSSIFGQIYTIKNGGEIFLEGVRVAAGGLISGGNYTTLTNNNGEFRLQLPVAVTGDIYSINFSLPGYISKQMQIEVQGNFTKDLGKILLESPDTGTTIYGKVKNLVDNSPVDGIEVTATNQTTNQEDKINTDKDGIFFFNEIEPGEYKVKAQKNSLIAQAVVSVASGQTVGVTLYVCDASQFITTEIEGFTIRIDKNFQNEIAEHMTFLQRLLRKVRELMRQIHFSGKLEFHIYDIGEERVGGAYSDKFGMCFDNNQAHIIEIDINETVIKEFDRGIMHEFGHAVQEEKNLRRDLNWINAFSSYSYFYNECYPIQGIDWSYGQSSERELFAEFFVAYFYYHDRLYEGIENLTPGSCQNTLRFMWQFFAEKVGKVNSDDAQKYPSIGSKVWTPDEIRAGAWMQRRSVVSRALSWVTAQAGAVAQTVVSAARGNQGVIVGAISDRNQQILKNATVLVSKPEFKKINRKWVVVSQNYQVKTDDNGNFRLENIPAGFYFVTIITEDGNWLTPGHAFRTISVVGRGQTQEFNISLE